jgi:SAM-dependent methyltransferase
VVDVAVDEGADDETAGALEPFEDAALYDWEYRRRRDDLKFYRRLADERGGPVLDLGCGTGRLMAPLLRDGHVVVGLDHSPAMLTRAQARVSRLGPVNRRRALLVRGDLRTVAFAQRFAFAIVAFHGIQHLVDDQDLAAFFSRVREALIPGGWLAFDVFAPAPDLIARARTGAPARRWDRTVFRHPVSGQREAYSASFTLDERRHTFMTTFHYQPIDAHGRPDGPERHARLCHRQVGPAEVGAHLTAAGFQLLQRWSDFEGTPLEATAPSAPSEQDIYLARRV